MGDKMIYKKFYFKNYKGIKETSIELDKNNKLYCIIGQNESGKTTILEGIRDAITLLEGKELTSIYDDGIMECVNKRSDEINFDIIFGVSLIITAQEEKTLKLKQDEEITFEFIYHFIKAQKSEQKPFEILCEKKTKDKNGNDNIIEVKQQEKIEQYLNVIRENKIYPVAYYYSDFFTKFPEEIPFDFKNDNKYKDEIIYWQNLLEKIGKYVLGDNFLGFQELSRMYFDGGASTSRVEKDLSKISKHIENEIKTHWMNYFKNDAGNFDTFQLKINGLRSKSPEIIITIDIKDKDGNPFSIKDKSLGFRWYFNFLLSTLYCQSKETLFLLDEPASNLFADVQTSIVEVFEKMTKNDDKSLNSYIIYSTHSHYLYKKNIANATHVAYDMYGQELENNETNGINVYKVSDLIGNENKIKSLRVFTDHFRVQVPNIELQEHNLICEGFEDYCFINLFCYIILNRIPNVCIVHGFGASNLSDIITSAIINRKKFLVLLDKDQGGENATTKYQNKFDCIWNDFLINRVKNLRDFITKKTITDIQSLLTDNDRKKICSIANIDFLENDEIKIKKYKTIQAVKRIYFSIIFEENKELEANLKQENLIENSSILNFKKLADAIEKHFNSK